MRLKILLLKNDIKIKLNNIQLVASDVDGVLTNGQIIYDSQETEYKSFNVKDGMAVKLLQSIGIKTALISGANSTATHCRAKTLSINECYTGVEDKCKKLEEIQNKLGIKPEQTLYIGDDINDLNVRKRVSLFVTPKDSNYLVRKEADIKSNKKGGYGVLRDICDIILYLRDKKYFHKDFYL